MTPIRILLIEHEPIMSKALRELLGAQQELNVVAEAVDAKSALALAEREQPDIVLLDLPADGDILDALPDLLNTACEAQAVVLTDQTDLAQRRRAILQGALGSVIKEQSSENLLQAIQQVHAGGVWMEGSLLADMVSELKHNSRSNAKKAEVAMIAAITPREGEVIILICEGLTNRQIALRLHLSERTVHRHLSTIFEKLDVGGRLQLCVFAQRTGLLDPPST